MKNIILILLFIGIIPVAWGRDVFASSCGAGIININDFGGGIDSNVPAENMSINIRLPMNMFSGGFFVYADYVYVEIQEAFLFGGGNWKVEIGKPINQNQEVGFFSFFVTDMGILLKYPFVVSSKIYIFPLLGMDYMMFFYTKLSDTIFSDPFSCNQLWFKGGVGVDYNFLEILYFRFEVLYGIRLPNVIENGSKDIINAYMPQLDNDTLIGHGITIKIAIGF
jgi:hypothetical protein